MPLFSMSNVTFKNLIHYPQLEIIQNHITFICGKSGSGKSTLLKLLNTSVSPDSGELFYHDKPIQDYNTIHLRRRITLVSQQVFLFDDTIRQNFWEFYRYRELPPPDDAVILSYLLICLAEFPLDTNCRQMSGGERQRVFIAVCLSFMLEVLMLDEPTSALDEQTSAALMENLTIYCKEHGITLIVITHNKLLAELYADEMIHLDWEVGHE